MIIISNDPDINVIKQIPAHSDSGLKGLLSPVPFQIERIEGVYVERHKQHSIMPKAAVKSSLELTPSTSVTSKRVDGILVEGQDPDSSENIKW